MMGSGQGQKVIWGQISKMFKKLTWGHPRSFRGHGHNSLTLDPMWTKFGPWIAFDQGVIMMGSGQGQKVIWGQTSKKFKKLTWGHPRSFQGHGHTSLTLEPTWTKFGLLVAFNFGVIMVGSSEGHFRSGHKFTVIGLLNLAWTQLMREIIYFMVEILYKPPPRRDMWFANRLVYISCYSIWDRKNDTT